MFSIPASTRAPYEARHTLEQVLEGHDRVADILLATSELVSNALIHGELEEGDLIRLEVDLLNDRVKVSVSHRGPPVSPPSPHEARGRPGGHGFSIVGQISDRWKVEHRNGVTRVWFEA